MKQLIVLLFFFFSISSIAAIDRLGFYRAFESDSKSQMETEIKALKEQKQSIERDAYLGALLMKMSQFEATPKDKAEEFKKGRDLLEASISQSPKNSEYRFLRLAIQENVPKILKYSNNIKEDTALIYSSFQSMDALLKKVIRSYANNSVNLDVGELK